MITGMLEDGISMQEMDCKANMSILWLPKAPSSYGHILRDRGVKYAAIRRVMTGVRSYICRGTTRGANYGATIRRCLQSAYAVFVRWLYYNLERMHRKVRIACGENEVKCVLAEEMLKVPLRAINLVTSYVI